VVVQILVTFNFKDIFILKDEDSVETTGNRKCLTDEDPAR
jgi:hypothetical protein